MESKTESRFARFSTTIRVADIEAQRKDFADEVLKFAAESKDYGTFRRTLDDELLAAGLPLTQHIAGGQIFSIHTLPFTLVIKVERTVGPNPDKSPTATESKAAARWPQLLPHHYGYIIHQSPREIEPSWAISIWERILPFPFVEKFALGIATDAFKKTHWGVRFGSGELLLIDAGGANLDAPEGLPF